MTENKKTTNKASDAQQASAVDSQFTAETATTNQYVLQDFRTSILIVSVLVNLVILTGWIAIQATTAYDMQVVGLLFNR